jgi:bifunctional polynucleotide phosphatase/kinase
LITTSSGNKFAKEASDWKWWDPSVVPKLKELYDDDYQIVIFSNQAGLTLHPDPNAKGPKSKTDRVAPFKQKCSAILSQINLPVTLYAATGKDIFRKPRPGMWNEFLSDYDLDAVDLENSVFIGDAGGRTAVVVAAGAGKGKDKKATAKDFSCSDRNFAHNVGIRYMTPEEFFLGESPRDFVRDFDLEKYPHTQQEDGAVLFEKKNDKEIVMFCGPPGAGKSTFFWKHLKPLGYERINQDILKSRDKCVAVATKHLDEGESVAIDNTNADAETRAVWVKLAQKHKLPIRCIWFKTPLAIAQHNEAVRSMNTTMNPEARTVLPTLAFSGFNSRFKEPKKSEGFSEVVEIEFSFTGSPEEYDVWGKYWL